MLLPKHKEDYFTGPLLLQLAFNIDFNPEFKKSLWNRHILQKFTQELRDQYVEEQWGLPEVTNHFIDQLLIGALRQSQYCWQQAQPQYIHEEKRHEMHTEVNERTYKTSA